MDALRAIIKKNGWGTAFIVTLGCILSGAVVASGLYFKSPGSHWYFLGLVALFSAVFLTLAVMVAKED